MVNKFLLLSLMVIIPTSAYAQVTDQTVGGIIVPNIISTQNKYCNNGQCATATIPIPANYTYSTSKLPILLISLSNTCEILDKHNMKGCPPVKDLIKYDNSNQLVSGQFVSHNGIYTRNPPQLKHNWLAYQYSNHTIICVECAFDVTATDKSKQIIIQPNSFSFVNKSETESNNAYYNFIGRSMQGCDTATIANLPGLLNDTIHYMLSGCLASKTGFHGIENHTRTLHPFSYDNPYSTLHQDALLKSMMQGHTYDFGNKTSGGRGPPDCIRHACTFTDPYKKVGW